MFFVHCSHNVPKSEFTKVPKLVYNYKIKLLTNGNRKVFLPNILCDAMVHLNSGEGGKAPLAEASQMTHANPQRLWAKCCYSRF